MIKLFIILVVTLSLALAGKHDLYSNNTVHGVKLRDRSDLELLEKLESELNVDMWQHGIVSVRDAMVMLTLENRFAFLAALDERGIEHYVEVPDVAKFLDNEEDELNTWRKQRSDRAIFQDYPRYEWVDEYMERIARQYPELVTLVTPGLSYEGRAIKYLKISTTNYNDPSKPIYFMDAMIHAREWVTTPVTLYSIFRLVENLRAEDRDLRDDVDWIIMPIVNPDGYEYSHTNQRLWRKTRSLNPLNEACIGADGNRNFDVLFNTTGVSTNPCALTYPGVEAFSEPETRYIRDIMFEYLDRIQLYMNIHSHGNYVLYGYGNATLPANGFQLHHVGAAMGAAMDAVKLPQANYYAVGNSALVLYGTSGSAQDYGQAIGIPLSYTLELPGYGFQFSVPPQFIDQINEETWRGIAVTARLARSYYSARYTPTP